MKLFSISMSTIKRKAWCHELRMAHIWRRATDEETAEAMGRIYGEKQWRTNEVLVLVAEAPAPVGDARSGETRSEAKGLDPKDEHAVGEAEAPNLLHPDESLNSHIGRRGG